MSINWDEIRGSKFAAEAPPDWPSKVRGISIGGVGLLGVHEETGELYWDGRKLLVQKPITLGGWERFLAALTALSAVGLLVVEVGRAATWWGG